MFVIVQHTPLCDLALLAVLVLLGVQARRRRRGRFEHRDVALIEEIRLMAEADLEAKHLAVDAPRPSF